MGLESCGLFIGALIVLSSIPILRKPLYPAAICIMVTTLLGFADDVLDIRWRVKFLIPFVSSLPILLNYKGSTTILFHGFLSPIQKILGVSRIDIGIFYYIYMITLLVFCTHSINIHAGINGLEIGQCIVIASFLLFHCLIYWSADLVSAKAGAVLLIPFIASCFGLLFYNWYPSRVFVGDVFTLTAGSVIATVGILGHFAEMTLLFMTPQVLNFLLSLPQLIGIIPCPRHRLPVLNKETGKLEGKKDHMNVVNYWLLIFGPKTEERLCIEMMLFQTVCCCGAYALKYLYHQRIR
jgi:UDP-N-acetylglucosamine--dolichyl-phosphate N-acetylglucosaminephosphotransferase